MTMPKDNNQPENARQLRMEITVERSSFLSALGLDVLRFPDRDIDRDFRGVCKQIDMTI